MAKTPQKNSTWSSTSPVPASKAKAHFLELVSTVDKSGAELVITKRGKPVAKLIPYSNESRPDIVGCMKGTFKITGDIISPEPDIWEAMQ